MNIYRKKITWKLLLLLSAVLIGMGSLWYTNTLVEKLSKEERKKVELWAKATSLIPKEGIEGESLDFLFSVVQFNETVPVILVDSDTNIIMHRNIDTVRKGGQAYLENLLSEMIAENKPIEIPYLPGKKQYIYYSPSTILTTLSYYPFVQLGVILLFIVMAYLAFSSSRKAEQNQVWVGLSKETAHQLGTPISSLMAWLELLKQSHTDPVLLNELNKDVKRLSKITERFSKIGSQPVLSQNNVVELVQNTMEYLRTRTSDKVQFELITLETTLIIPLNPPLFEWVLENICKNAIDAIEGEGNITIRIENQKDTVGIDIADNGKGIPKSKQKTIFKPGYTTKARGWGLGLSLARRIVEEYHKGRIFVAESDADVGTTMRIVLKKHLR